MHLSNRNHFRKSNINMADGHIQKHLHSMFHLLRSEETLKMAVKLESARYGRTRYLVVVSCSRKPTQRETSQQNLNIFNAQNINLNNSNHLNNNNNNRKSAFVQQTNMFLSNQNLLSKCTNNYTTNCSNLSSTYIKSGTQILMNEKDLTNNLNIKLGGSATKHEQKQEPQDQQQQQQTNQVDNKCLNEIEEACLLGIDCNETTTVGLVLRILGDTTIRLDGDGGFCISGSGRTHIFKPVSVQAMWSALQTLHKVCAKARENKFFPGGPSHEWVTYYDERIFSDRSCLNEWNAMDSIESRRPPSPDAIRNRPTEREETEQTIRTALKEIIVQLDLDEVTSKYIRTRLEEHLDMNLTEYKSFLDQELLIILGQMDAPTKIFEHVYLGSEWNASNLDELQQNGVRHILNVTREIDNFFPGMFDYFNVRVYDDEKTNLLKHWDNTFKYISQAKNDGSKVLVHCKMGVSRSASVVIAYAMKAYGWTFNEALDHVKTNRNCIKPNKNFLTQLETYQGMLLAMKNKEKLQRSKSDTNLRSVKDARLLPGSEPTPLIQAFNAAAKKLNVTAFQNRIMNCINRPKSWSPDSVESAVLLPKQHSQSLENIPPERIKSKNNVRLPCKNGQNYSVSQNQVFHLEENNSLQQYLSSVKLIVNELESNQKRRFGTKKMNKDQWDPGEKISPETMRRNLASENRQTTCDKTSTPFGSKQQQQQQKQNYNNESPFSSLRRSESTKSKNCETGTHHEKFSPVMKSKSLESSPNAVTTASTPAINALPITINKPIVSPNNRNSAPDDSRSTARIPFPGWTRRCSSYNPTINSSSRSASSSSNSSSSSNVSLSGMSADLISDLFKSGSKNVKNLRNAYSLREKNVSNVNQLHSTKATELVVPSIKVEKRNMTSDSDSESSFVNMTIARFTDQFSKDFMQRIKKRCKSDETLYDSDIMSTVNKRLSSSSPSEYSADKTFLARPTFTWSNRMATTKNSNNIKMKRIKNRLLCRTVENLKLNFESKETESSGFAKEPKRGKSLPSSPIASTYNNIMTNTITSTTTNTNTIEPTLKLNYDKLGCEEISVKGLVDKYEVTKKKSGSSANAFTTTTNTSPIFANLNACLKRTQHHHHHYHHQQQRQQQQHQQKHQQQFQSNEKSTLNANIIHPKPPPIPNSPIVTTRTANNNILLPKRMQQENSQSFARLKQHFDSASAYNTM